MHSIMQHLVLHLHRMEGICSAQPQVRIRFPCMRLTQRQDFLIRNSLSLISGDYPKDLVIFPDNKHIAVANHASNTVTTFTVDYDKNIIVMNDKPHHIETPNSIHIWPVPDEVAPEGDQSEEQEEFE